MASTIVPVDVELSLVERIAKIEDSLKDLKRAARQELKARRRRRSAKVGADGKKVAKGETPEQLKAWHEEVRKVWDEMRKADEKTPYKRAVAEASARRKGTPVTATASAPATEKKVVRKVVKAEAAAPVSVAVTVEAPKKVAAPRVVKKSA
uniref:Uncharacterized protein n=1 Tax=viral metagenome TaxID=1070528 RepID=A0A6C0HGD5_9ZZZZ